MTNNPNALDWCRKHNACEDARVWVRLLGSGVGMNEAWRKCHRPDWLCWALNKLEEQLTYDALLMLARELEAHAGGTLCECSYCAERRRRTTCKWSLPLLGRVYTVAVESPDWPRVCDIIRKHFGPAQ